MKRVAALLAALGLCLSFDACRRGVSGHTYHNNGGVVQVQFRSGCQAYLSDDAASKFCRYSESGTIVNLVCDGDTTNLKIDDDGALVGPPRGRMARLTPLIH